LILRPVLACGRHVWAGIDGQYLGRAGKAARVRLCHLSLKACIKTPDVGMLIAASGLTMVRFLAEFTLSEAEGLGMTEGRRARDDNCGTNGFDTGSQAGDRALPNESGREAPAGLWRMSAICVVC